MQIAIREGRQQGLPEPQGQRGKVRQYQPDFKLSAVAFQRASHTEFPRALNARQVGVQIYAGQHRDGGRMSDLATEQWCETMAAGDSVQEFVGRQLQLPGLS